MDKMAYMLVLLCHDIVACSFSQYLAYRIKALKFYHKIS